MTVLASTQNNTTKTQNQAKYRQRKNCVLTLRIGEETLIIQSSAEKKVKFDQESFHQKLNLSSSELFVL
jgi:hypothetical protein